MLMLGGGWCLFTSGAWGWGWGNNPLWEGSSCWWQSQRHLDRILMPPVDLIQYSQPLDSFVPMDVTVGLTGRNPLISPPFFALMKMKMTLVCGKKKKRKAENERIRPIF